MRLRPISIHEEAQSQRPEGKWPPWAQHIDLLDPLRGLPAHTPHQTFSVCSNTDTGFPEQWPCHRFDKAGNGRGQIHPDTPRWPVSGIAFSQRHRVLPWPVHTKVLATQIKTYHMVSNQSFSKNIFLSAFWLNPIKIKSKATHLHSNYFFFQ